MTRKNSGIIPILVLVLIVSACGGNLLEWAGTNETSENVSTDDRGEIVPANVARSNGVDLAAEENTGIAECDELIAYIEQNSEEIGKDSIVARGVIEYYKQWIYSNLRKGIANAKPEEKDEYAEQCRRALKKLKEQQQQQQRQKSSEPVNDKRS